MQRACNIDESPRRRASEVGIEGVADDVALAGGVGAGFDAAVVAGRLQVRLPRRTGRGLRIACGFSVQNGSGTPAGSRPRRLCGRLTIPDLLGHGRRARRRDGLITRSETFALFGGTFVTDDGWVNETIAIEHVDEYGRGLRQVTVDPDDLGAALEELNSLWIDSLDDGARRTVELIERLLDMVNLGDLDGLAGPVGEDLERSIIERPAGLSWRRQAGWNARRPTRAGRHP